MNRRIALFEAQLLKELEETRKVLDEITNDQLTTQETREAYIALHESYSKLKEAHERHFRGGSF